MKKVKAIRDEDGHWYIIPNELVGSFNKELYNEDFVGSGGFGDKYGQYMTGGDLNNMQLYVE